MIAVRLSLLLLIAISCRAEAATIVLNHDMQLINNPPVPPGTPPANYRLDTPGDSIWLHYDGNSLQAVMETVGYGVSLHLVHAGAAYSRQTIANDLYQPLATSGPSLYPAVTIDPSHDIYLGVSYGPPNYGVFGWVRLKQSGGALEMVENVIAYRAEGIVVGTTLFVPEPTTALTFVAVIAVFSARQRSYLAARHSL